MADGRIVRAAYNFVPFSDRVLAYQGPIPAHNAVDPGLKTGEIHVTLRAETPVFVSDGEAGFFRGPDGALQIPGSTIRGMVRQNMQILGFGLVRPGEDIQDRRLFFRQMACPENTVFSELKKYYDTALAVERGGRENRSVPREVKAGYLRRVGGGYQIRPVKGEVLRVPRKHPDVQAFGRQPARSFPVSYIERNGQVEKIQRGSVPGMEHGFLLYTGQAPDRERPNPLYLFPEEDREGEPVVLKDEALVRATDQDLRSGLRLRRSQNPDDWSLPRGGERKPVFYVRWNGQVCFGLSLFLRLRYRNSIADGLPEAHKERLRQPDFLDWPRAILGWAEKKTSWRSRVSFGGFYARGQAGGQEEATLMLSEPKPAYFPAYVKDGRHYDEAGFRLRGYKHYWLKEARPPLAERGGVTLRPLPAGTEFTGVIRYKNLRPEELGLLLWAIRLEEGCFQSVGMGKPWGYGRMRVCIDGLREFEIAGMYRPGSLCTPPARAGSSDAVQAYIDAYDAAAAKALKLEGSITRAEEIQDFLFMKRTVRPGEERVYMPIFDHRSANRPLPDAAVFRREAEAVREAEPPKEESMEDALERLKQRFGKL